MATLRDIHSRINAVSNTSKITQAMRMVSAAKLRKAQEAVQSARPYFKKMNSILANLVESVGEEYTHPLIQKSNIVKNVVAIVIASDRGLCGSFNNNLYKFAISYFNETLKIQYPGVNIKVIPVGKKTCAFFDKSDYEVIKPFSGIFHTLQFSTVKEIIDNVDVGFSTGEIDRVIVINNEFKNLITQVPASRVLLPIEPSHIEIDLTLSKKKKLKMKNKKKKQMLTIFLNQIKKRF